jgi:hypothetical protein
MARGVEMRVGELVTVFDAYPGVIVKAPAKEGWLTVLYQMPGGVKVRALIELKNLKVRDVK